MSCEAQKCRRLEDHPVRNWCILQVTRRTPDRERLDQRLRPPLQAKGICRAQKALDRRNGRTQPLPRSTKIRLLKSKEGRHRVRTRYVTSKGPFASEVISEKRGYMLDVMPDGGRLEEIERGSSCLGQCNIDDRMIHQVFTNSWHRGDDRNLVFG